MVVYVLQLLGDFHQLLAQAYGIAALREHNAIEGIGNDEYGQVGVVLQLHLTDELPEDAAVLVDAEHGFLRQVGELAL